MDLPEENENEKGHTASELLQLVSFRLGREEFAIDILKVQEIIRMIDITNVPKCSLFVEGVINLRGKVIPVINMRKRINLEPIEYTKETRIVVVEVDGNTIGFIVDSVSEILRLPVDTIEPPPENTGNVESDYIKGIGRLDDRLLILLDLYEIFSNSEIGLANEAK